MVLELVVLLAAGSWVSGRVVRTSEDSCFRVCVKFLLASAKALVSNFGFLAGGSPLVSLVSLLILAPPEDDFRLKASGCGVKFR